MSDKNSSKDPEQKKEEDPTKKEDKLKKQVPMKMIQISSKNMEEAPTPKK